MKKCNQSSTRENRWARILLLIILLFSFITGSPFAQHKTLLNSVSSENQVPFANVIKTYRVPWWGTEGSVRSRSMYGVINIDNGKLSVRHAMLEGTKLGDFRLPYWPIEGFISIVSESAELSHQGSIILTNAGKRDTIPFRIGDEKNRYIRTEAGMKRVEEGFELAQISNGEVLKVTNNGSSSPIFMEYFFIIYKNSTTIPVIVRATNKSDQTIQDAIVQVSYSQDFNWSSFGVSSTKNYQPLIAPTKGESKNFFAFSSGMQRGFEFNQVNGCVLSYFVNNDLNDWKVTIYNTATTLAPGASMVFQYNLRVIDKPLVQTLENKSVSKKEFEKFVFIKMKPTFDSRASINPEGRVTIHEVIQNINKPKIRGLNLRTDFAHAFDDLGTLKEWGGNLVITNMMNPEEGKRVIERGHGLGMEMFISGAGGFMNGSPKFDRFFATNPKPNEFPDSYGQDEDHYYWFGVKPTINFETNFGKKMSSATLKDKATYWSQCFVEKWRKVLANVREHDPDGNVWFYCPSPGVANIEPLDFYDLFFSEVSKLGDALTVFPFYYGVEYNQIEYMMHRWKNAGIHRVVFLPMSDFMTRPSQFLRAITAARRGGSDGTCGFAFMVGREVSGKEWQWKSVMLAAQANFPTPELNAYCFIEEPAELVEELAVSDVNIYSSKSDTVDFLKRLEKMLPGHVQWINGLPEKLPQEGQIHVIVGDDKLLDQSKWVYDVHQQNPGAQKGVLQMSGTVVRLNGSDLIGLKNAEKLFLRFAELAKAEGIH
jgi:hypothetical protein